MQPLITLLLRCGATVLLATAAIVFFVDLGPGLHAWLSRRGAFGIGLEIGGGLIAIAAFIYLLGRIWDNKR